MFKVNKPVVAALVMSMGVAASCSAGVIFDTGAPGGDFGYYGFDVYARQSVAVAFTPSANYTLDSIGLWMMSNDFDNPGAAYTLTLRADAGSGAVPTTPGNTILESWNMATEAVGWSPVLDSAVSVSHPLLAAGQSYWLVAESSLDFNDPIWVTSADNGPTYLSLIDFQSSPAWQSGLVDQGGAPGAVVNASAVVPEPGALAALVLPAVGLVRRRR